MNLIPIQNPTKRLRLIGSVEGRDIIFVNTELGVYEIDLKTLDWKVRLKGDFFSALIPYMSFYNPSGISMSLYFYDSLTTLISNNISVSGIMETFNS